MTTVGTQQFKFEVVHNWAPMPSGWGDVDVAAVCADSDLNVYLYCRGDHPVRVFDASGVLIAVWGDGQFSLRTHGIHMSHSDELYLVDDGASKVGHYTTDGVLLNVIGPVGQSSNSGYDGVRLSSVRRAAPPFNRPTNVATAPSGDVYVSDGYGNCRIHRFSRDGLLVQSWGEPGSGDGQFVLPHSAWVHNDGRVFVADRQNDRIQIFSPLGEWLGQWTDVQKPQDIYIDSNDYVYVAEAPWFPGQSSSRRGYVSTFEHARMSIFDIEGNLMVRWGEPDGSQPGSFTVPHSVWVDVEGSIYVSEVPDTVASSQKIDVRRSHRIQKFARL